MSTLKEGFYIPYEEGKKRIKELFRKNPDQSYYILDIVEKDEELWVHLSMAFAEKAVLELNLEGILEVIYIHTYDGPMLKRYQWKGEACETV